MYPETHMMTIALSKNFFDVVEDYERKLIGDALPNAMAIRPVPLGSWD
jgi:hypothetical protein